MFRETGDREEVGIPAPFNNDKRDETKAVLGYLPYFMSASGL